MGADCANPLLVKVQDAVLVRYYTTLNTNLGRSVEVKVDAGDGKGKGVFVTQNYAQGDIIFTEQSLASTQHLDSKLEVSTCSHCFQAVGTVEQHIGGKICCLINELSEATEQDDLQQVQARVDKIHAAVDSPFLEGLLSGAIRLPLTHRVDMARPVPCRAGCGDEYCSMKCEVQAWENHHCLLCTVGTDNTAAASSSASKGSGKEAAAEVHQQDEPHGQGHSAYGGDGCAGSSSQCGSSGCASSSKTLPSVVHQVHGARVNRLALAEFLDHADGSNDIFRVAAQVIASTIITSDKILQQQAQDAVENSEAQGAYHRAVHGAAAIKQQLLVPQHQQQHEMVNEVVGSQDQAAQTAYQLAVAAAAEAGSRTAAQVLLPEGPLSGRPAAEPSTQPHLWPSDINLHGNQQQQQHLAALQLAFLPFALGHKAAWWDIPLWEQQDQPACKQAAAAAVSCETQPHAAGSRAGIGVDALELSAQMRELAGESLALLRRAIKDDRFPQLFDIQLYGCLIGMFEMNNLAVTVPAPVARYKALLLHPDEAGIAAAEAAAALAEVAPLLEALGEAADEPAEGTGFYALQSCINHSCTPNAAADCLATGQTVIRALRHVPAGTEVLLSYIEEEGAGLQERRQMLRDYCFICHCDRCTAEEITQRLEHHKLPVV